jgi:prepilin-type processing-associated H-X9-DG protein
MSRGHGRATSGIALTRSASFRRRGYSGAAVLGLVGVLAALLVPGALGAKPDREPFPLGPALQFSPGEACPVAVAPGGVTVSIVGGNAANTTFADGRVMYTGLFQVKVTNDATGASVDLTLSGSTAFVTQANGDVEIRLGGRNLWSFFPTDVGPGVPGTARLYYIIGRATILNDPDSNIIAFESGGQLEDICAMIA